IFGFAGALIWSRLLTRVRKLQNSIFTTPAFVFIIYGLADLLGYSGAIAALVFGITMANIDTFTNAFLLKIMGGRGHKLNRTEMVFFGEIVFLLKTVFFVYIGVSIEFNDLRAVIAGLIITFLLFFARILITRFFAPKKASVFDKTITSLMIPKGLAAAVLAGMPVAMGIPDGLFIKNVTYSVILFSISWVSIMILLVDKSKKIRRVYEWIYGKKTELSVVGDGTIFKTDKEKMEESQEDGLNTYFERSASSVLSAQAEKREKREKSDFPLLTAETISSSFNAIKDVNDIIDSQTNLDTDETEKESTVDFSEEKNKTKNAFEEVNRENTPLQKD
ncbi:MAG: cation:proton antiporter, partial [Bacteroidales bacterium]